MDKITVTVDNFWTIELGDVKSPDLQPQVKVMVWDNECNFSMRLSHAGNMEQVGEFFKFTAADLQANIDANGVHVTLYSKPDTNQIVYTVRTKNVSFHKQPEGEWIEGVWNQHEPHIVNSFAVYHAYKSGGHKYKTGKVFHMSPPKCTDANGVEAWCDWDIDLVAETLTVHVPQSFLDSATYPVVID